MGTSVVSSGVKLRRAAANPSPATVNGFGTLDVDAGVTSLNVSTFGPAYAPPAMRYWIDAAGVFCFNYPGGTFVTSRSVFGRRAPAPRQRVKE